ncbi:MAG: hypothetical protein AVDCRST_MAG95-3411 [uncultured Adhaeribacter sp.]|uniref:Outer membrane protein beta-barrel domain-containing protein n=1 Tax=uncultured Adhaeribacter sp. TaxID=448109 RepID=A0A6J4JMJ0_9BACT|nr:MAG: hypothetical protein AVDCRST_MAG95-3411 [uncultured Adhaeribacter sp.]
MNHLTRLVIAIIFSLAGLSLPSFAQKGEIKGKVLDGASKKPLPYATIAVYRAQDTTLVTFRVTDDKGIFRATSLPLQVRLRVVASLVGFGVYRKEVTLSAPDPAVDLGEVLMSESTNLLSEVLVTAEVPPIIVRKDTLEFNAASFKTLPTSLVEDLLKKLPGVAVDQAGNIRVNGKAVQKILVDGKAFFGDDPKIATRNLPADVIDKVQVMNDPEALRRNPNLPASEIPQVVNLKLKKSIKKGLFGKLYAGTGTNSLYEGGGILNIFRDTTQISVLGYSNNLNRPGFGFEDISRIGGFSRSGMSSMMVRSDGGFAINDISFGATGSGIQQSSGAGTNFNTLLKNGFQLNGQYFFGRIDGDLQQVTNANQFLDNRALNTRSTLDQNSTNLSHRIGGRLEGKLDSLTNFNITPSITFQNASARQNSLTSTLQDVVNTLNQSDNTERGQNASVNFTTNWYLYHRFRKKGRSINYYGTITAGNADNNQYNTARNIFYQPEPVVTLLDQYRENDQSNVSVSNTLQYEEPLFKNVSGNLQLSSEYFNNRNTVGTYARGDNATEYGIPLPDLSSLLNRQGWRHNLTTGIRLKLGELSFQPGVRFSTLAIANSFRASPNIRQDFFYLNPTLTIFWKQLNFSYSSNIQEPNISDLQPIINNTNPLYIFAGNPNLKPALSNNVNLYYYKFDSKRLLNINVYSYGSIQKNGTVRERSISAEGVQTTRPVNVEDAIWSLGGGGQLMKDFKFNTKNQFSVGGNMRYSYSNTLVLVDNQKSKAKIWELSPSAEARINLDNKIELNQTFSLNNQRSFYTGQVFDNRTVNFRTWNSEVIIRAPKKLVWESQLEYRYTSNVAPGLRRSYTRINAAITYLFLKNDRAQLKLAVYDILNQNLSTYRSIQENIVQDFQATVLQRYGLLTLTYNIRNFGGKVGGSNSLFRF